MKIQTFQSLKKEILFILQILVRTLQVFRVRSMASKLVDSFMTTICNKTLFIVFSLVMHKWKLPVMCGRASLDCFL